MYPKRLIILFMLLVVLTATAQDSLPLQRSCRMGRANPEATRRASAHSWQGRAADANNPYVGDRRQLVVLAAFSDYSFKGDSLATLQQWDKIFNQEGYNESSYVGSVHDYFYDQSYTLFNLTFDLQYVTVGPRSRYPSYDEPTLDEYSQYLVLDIVDSLRKRNVDWSLYDWDGNGQVNQLLIVYAGKGQNDGGGSNTIWPHQWWLSEHVDQTTGEPCKVAVVSSGGSDYVVDKYCAVQELGSSSNPFGTLCHEYSHCFGFPDFYYGGTKYVGGWDLMDYGNYNGNGYVPCNYSAHERWLMGWLTPQELVDNTNVNKMSALCDVGETYLIRNDAYSNEYYLIENRQQKGWDAKLPGSGVVVFHIDYDEESWTNPYSSPNHGANSLYPVAQTRYTIFPANNHSSVYYQDGWAYPYSANNQLTNTSFPAATLWNTNSDGSLLMNKSITDISVTDGMADFKFSSTATAIKEIVCQDTRSNRGDVIYNLAGQRVMSPQKGVYIINGKCVVVK